jgi:hypothetical protein
MVLIEKIERSKALQIIFFVVLGLIYFWPSLLGGPTFIDDDGFIFKSQRMIETTNPLIFWDRTTHYARSWPLSYTIFWVMYQFFANNFWLYKLTNLILHIFNASLLLNIFKSRTGFKLALTAATIFLIHPIQIETVSWIFQLKTILATTFALLSFNFFIYFLKRKDIFNYVSALYLFLFSLLSKISAILLPFVFMYQVFKKDKVKNYRAWLILLPFFALSLMTGLENIEAIKGLNLDERLAIELNEKSEKAPEVVVAEAEVEQIEEEPEPAGIEEEDLVAEQPVEEESSPIEEPESEENVTEKEVTESKLPEFITKAKIISMSFSHYLLHFFFPLNLSIVQGDITEINIYNISAWILFAILICLILLNIFIWKKDYREELQVLGVYILAVFPILGFVYIPFMNFSLVAEHWLYLGMIPLCFLVVLILNRLQSKKIKVVIGSLFIIFWSIQGLTYVHVFNHKYKLIEKAIEMAPRDYRFRMELATKLLNDKKTKEAQLVIEEALSVPELSNSMILLMQGGYIDRQLGNNEKLAEKIFKIGMLSLENGNVAQAKLMLEQLKEINSDPSLIEGLKNSLKSR